MAFRKEVFHLKKETKVVLVEKIFEKYSRQFSFTSLKLGDFVKTFQEQNKERKSDLKREKSICCCHSIGSDQSTSRYCLL